VRDQEVEQGPQVGAGGRQVERRGAGPGVGVGDGELDLMLVGAQVQEQLVDLVHDLHRPRVASVDLVDGDDDRQPQRHGLLEHVARLRQRALGGVHEQQHGVDHQQRALHLAAEVGVARRVHDVEPDGAVLDAGLLGEDGDALLALEVHRVHDPLRDHLMRGERAGLAEQGVHERRLAVVDMGDDGEVAHVVARGASGGGVGAAGRGHGRA